MSDVVLTKISNGKIKGVDQSSDTPVVLSIKVGGAVNTELTKTLLDSLVNSQNPMTTGGDIIYGGASGVPTRLANGTAGQVLTSAGGTSAPYWSTIGGGSGDMILASVQTVTGLKTFDSGKLALNGATSGTTTLNASAIAGTTTVTLPGATTTLVGEDTTQTLTNKTLSSPTLSGTITTPLTASRLLVTGASSELAATSVTATEAGYLSGVTSSIQTQLNAKATSSSPTFSGTITTPLTASRALVTGASSELAVSATTATELGYVSGVTSSIQTQINSKAPTASPTFSGTVTVSDLTAGSLVFVGSGSALAQDNSNLFWDNTNKRLLISDTSAKSFGTLTPKVQSSSNSSTERSISSSYYGNDISPSVLALGKSRSGTIGTHTVVQSGDGLGAFVGYGSDGTTFLPAGAVSIVSDGTAGSNDMPGRVVFSTTSSGSSALTERARLNSSGNLMIGTMATAGASTRLQTAADSGTNSSVFQTSGAFDGSIIEGRTSQGTVVSPTDSSTTQVLADFGAKGYASFAFRQASYIRIQQDGSYTSNSIPSKMMFYTGDGTNANSVRMTIDKAGKVGVGIAPSTDFHVDNSSGARIRVSGANGTGYELGDANTRITLSATNTMSFYTSNTEYMKIDSAGKVGIGIAPSVNLHVDNASGARIRASGANGAGYELGDANTRITLSATNTMSFYTSNTEYMKISSTGNLLAGDSTARTFDSLTPKLQISSTSSTERSISSSYYGNDTSGSVLALGKSRGTSVGTQTVVASGDGLGAIVAYGSDGTGFIPAGSISIVCDGTPGANDMPGRIVFNTTADGASSVTERMRITNAGLLLAGDTTGRSFGSLTPKLQISSTSSTERSISSSYYGNDASGSVLALGKSRGGSVGTQTAVQSGDGLAAIVGYGSDGTAFIPAGSISIVSDNTPGTNDMPGRIVFSTTADGASSSTERMRIDSAGNVGIGKTASGNQLDLSTDGARKLTTTTWATGSDSRLKENIVLADLDICYNNIKNLPLKRFAWKASVPGYENVDDRNAIGWIAQDVATVFPNAVKVVDDYGISDCLTLQPDQIYKTMHGALQKLINLHEALRAEFDAYKETHP